MESSFRHYQRARLGREERTSPLILYPRPQRPIAWRVCSWSRFRLARWVLGGMLKVGSSSASRDLAQRRARLV